MSMNRRSFLQSVGTAGLVSAMPDAAFAAAHATHEVIAPQETAKPTYSIRFAVCGMAHDHIYGMVGAIQRGGGTLVSFQGDEPDKVAAFQKRYPDAKQGATEKEILDDPSIQLVLSSKIPSLRAALGIAVMKRGKDFLSDKPGMT